MRIDGPVELTEGQKKQARIAGIPADRPGLGAEYPKMVYRPGENPRHMHLGEALPIGNGKHDKASDKLAPGKAYETAFVDDEADEAEALENGWFLSPDPDAQSAFTAKMSADRAKDEEIAMLRAQLQASVASNLAAPEPVVPEPVLASEPLLEKRSPGRPRNEQAS